MARTAQHELSDEAKQAIAAADAEDAREDLFEQYAAEIDDEADDFAPASLSNPFALPVELARKAAPKNARNDAQLAVDAVVRDVHAKWLDAGEPRTWPLIVETGVVAGYWVRPQNEPKIQKMVKSSADLLGLSVRKGTTTPRTDDMPQDGRVFVNFTIVTRNEMSEETKAKMAAARANRKAAAAAS